MNTRAVSQGGVHVLLCGGARQKSRDRRLVARVRGTVVVVEVVQRVALAGQVAARPRASGRIGGPAGAVESGGYVSGQMPGSRRHIPGGGTIVRSHGVPESAAQRRPATSRASGRVNLPA